MQNAERVTQLFPYLWLVLLIGYVLAGVEVVPFHGDESTQIYMSRDYAYQFIERDYEKLMYSDTPVSPTEQQLRLLNGTVNKYLIGLAWHSSGYTVNDINEQWDWGADWQYNQQNGHAPSADLLQVARWPSALLLAGSVVVMFALGRALGGRWTPYLASLYYALNPALLLNGRRAMMEGSFMFFSLLTVLAGIWLLRQPSLRRTILLGLVSGAALASKHTALFTVAAVFVGILLYLIYQGLRSQDDSSEVDYVLLPYLVVAAVVMGGTFFALNPAWWNGPLERAETVLSLREDLLAGQSAVFGGYAGLSDQIGGFLRQSLLVLPQYYEVEGWANVIGGSINRYEASIWRGVSVGGNAVGGLLLCGMMAGGVWILLKPVISRVLRRQEVAAVHDWKGTAWLIGLWVLTMIMTTLLLTPLEWQRYYLPVYPAIGLIAALGLNHALDDLRARKAAQQPSATPTSLPEF